MANLKQNVNGIFYVKSAAQQIVDDETELYMNVSNAKEIRAAKVEASEYTTEEVVDKFVEIHGVVENEIIRVDFFNADVDISKIDLMEYFHDMQISAELIFQYFSDEISHFRKGLQDVCYSVVSGFYNYCDEEINIPIAIAELERRKTCVLKAFEAIWNWKALIEENSIEDKDIVFAGVILSNLVNSFANVSFPIMLAESAADILANEISYFGKSHLSDDEMQKLINSIGAFYFDDEETIRNKLTDDCFFKESEDE